MSQWNQMNAPPFHRTRIVAAVLALGLLSGCGAIPTNPGNGVPQPSLPDYILYGGAVGIWQELERVARTIPPALNDVGGLDGQGPLPTERIRDVPFRNTPQRLLRCEVHRPVDMAGPLRRVIVMYCGGGYVVDRDFDTLTVWANYLASRGFVVFNMRHRLLLESGVTRRDVFSDAVAGARFVMTAAATYGGDPDRVSLLGRSSGGQLALLVAMIPTPEHFGPAGDPDVPIRIRAVVDMFGPTDDRRYFNTNDFSVLPRSAIVAVYGGTPDEVPEAYAESAPVEYVHPGLPPIMIVHGALDTTVPPIQSAILADLLEASGNFVDRAFYREFGHAIGWGFIDNNALALTMPRIIRFLEERS